MPFKSPEQRRYLYSQKPSVAKKFAMEEKGRKQKKGTSRRGKKS